MLRANCAVGIMRDYCEWGIECRVRRMYRGGWNCVSRIYIVLRLLWCTGVGVSDSYGTVLGANRWLVEVRFLLWLVIWVEGEDELWLDLASLVYSKSFIVGCVGKIFGDGIRRIGIGIILILLMCRCIGVVAIFIIPAVLFIIVVLSLSMASMIGYIQGLTLLDGVHWVEVFCLRTVLILWEVLFNVLQFKPPSKPYLHDRQQFFLFSPRVVNLWWGWWWSVAANVSHCALGLLLV